MAAEEALAGPPLGPCRHKICAGLHALRARAVNDLNYRETERMASNLYSARDAKFSACSLPLPFDAAGVSPHPRPAYNSRLLLMLWLT